MPVGSNPQSVSENLPPGALGRLTWEEGGTPHERLITNKGLTIGRSSQNDLAVTDLAASRFHCKILPESNGLTLVDLESTNGTYLNGVRQNDIQPLKDGDRISIGQQVFQLQVAPPPSEADGGVPTARPIMDLPLEDTYVVPIEQNIPELVITSGMGRGTTFSLARRRMQIGRASRDRQWDIDLVDKSVSRPHAEIIHQGEDWLVKDLGSANGVLVNNQRIQDTQALKDGDVVELGETVMIFHQIGGG
jgi:pSer/pThr/pTyr-binding forkhead associated (FHA) protein